MKFIAISAGVLLLLATQVEARPRQGGLNIRLVEAYNEGSASSQGAALRDIESMLRRNLPYRNFRLVSSGSLSVPANGMVKLDRDVTVRCSGTLNNMSVVLERKRKMALQTRVRLSPGRPFIVGGFPSERGKLLVVLVVR
ncbi:MAG: hypothetical protein QGI24_09410 [Kiritimatiellia bacterium]|jgi:hypothetical protein|nr:hypothetical protein [Kiritimatiellia bacterium]MDP6848992.1 hypothetical protein [Kiritimatiellia bacterium]